MKRMVVALVAVATVVGSGCAPAALVLRGESKTRAADLSRCAMRQLELLGYTIQEGTPETGLIRATKSTATTLMVLRSGRDSEDRIVVTTESRRPDGGSIMRVAGETLFWGKDARKIVDRPSADVARQSNQILEACGILDAARIESP